MKTSRITTTVGLVLFLWASMSFAVPITLTKLTGLTGGTLAQTAVFRSDLSGLGLSTLLSVSITDNSGALGGANGQFSGFDLDAIILSTINCATAGCVAGLTGLSVFDYSPTGTTFVPGVQRVPVDPKLFGTDGTGNNVNNAVATLGAFDGESTTAIPGAFGFVSMGDNGILGFDLTSSVSTSGLFLYLGEVGDNGEVLAGSITVSDKPVPAPATLGILGIGLLGLGWTRRKRVQ